MELHESLIQNIRFLLIEVEKQLERTSSYLRSPSPSLISRIHASDDYIDNLKTFVQTKCFTLAAHTRDSEKIRVGQLKAYEIIAVNLERISDFCERVIDQSAHLDDLSVLQRFDFEPFFARVLGGIKHLSKALEEFDVQLALQVCRAEQELDELYAKMLKRILRELQEGAHAQTEVTILFISHYLERMGDSLLNGGEALLSACLGERIKIDQLRTLEDSLGDIDSDLEDVAMHAVGETKSGARIARLSARAGAQKSVIFKEGKTSKLIEERDSIAKWQELHPGIAPNIYSFHEEGSHSAILFEYLPGRTFEELLLEASIPELETALQRIMATVSAVWSKTRRAEPSKPRFMQQLLARVDDIRAVHPNFLSPGGKIADLDVLPYSQLVQSCVEIDATLECPHSVFIHGDFNVDNVIYDASEDRVRFIDLHRSRFMDYCQDVSVFLVSNFRLQAFETEMRRRINSVIERFFQFALGYAAQNGDRDFELRLALGLARSFATSTRFVLDESLARSMFLRSRFILQHVVAHRQAGGDFRFPKEVLFD